MKKTLISIALLGTLLVPAPADTMRSPVTEETQKSQHFVKYTYKNSSSVPVTVRVNATGSNLKTSQRMPYMFVVSPRGTKAAFQTSAKDPRSYYSPPDIDLKHQFGDYRLGASNMKLDLPFAKGKSATVESVDKNVVKFQMEEGQKVMSGRAGLVVSTEKDSVTVAHNDGSVTIYSGLESVAAKLKQQVNSGQELGTAGADPVTFQVAVPNQNLDYRALPANFTVGSSKTTVSAGEKYTR